MEAAILLSQSPYLVVDCEGRDIGRSNGQLSLLAIGTARAEHVFLFDVLNIRDATEPSLSALLSLLSEASIPKIMWDGRCDYLEILLLYGVQMKEIWDLQVAEIASQALRGEGESKRMAELAHRGGYTWKVVSRESHLFQGIYMVNGLAGIARKFHLTNELAKNPEVVAMHKAGESERWMERPLSPQLLQYSANDIYLIATAFTFFEDNGWILPDLSAQSARYITPETSRGSSLRLSAMRAIP
ncbi:unnamed protein product [Somion occarium]|uniref:3'-5' exonuclease domain-containing protein n=1 Tax=Somion occarium TaxID=3059160 RepID=A0ABP1DRQ3_9APHY